VLIGKLLLEHFFFDYFLHWSFRVQAAYCYVLCFPVRLLYRRVDKRCDS